MDGSYARIRDYYRDGQLTEYVLTRPERGCLLKIHPVQWLGGNTSGMGQSAGERAHLGIMTE
jgi:hypothetical protein